LARCEILVDPNNPAYDGFDFHLVPTRVRHWTGQEGDVNGDFIDPEDWLPPDPFEDIFGPWGPGGPFGFDRQDPFGSSGFEPPWGWGPEGPVYGPPPEPPWGWGPDGPVWDPPPGGPAPPEPYNPIGEWPSGPPAGAQPPPVEPPPVEPPAMSPPPVEPPPIEPPPVEPPPGASGAGVGGAVTAATWAAIGLLIVEVVSISNAIIAITDKDEINAQAENLNRIRDGAVRRHQWNDDLQREWTKASQALSKKAEQLQKELDDSWIMKLGHLIW
jgi:hypothetical protein